MDKNPLLTRLITDSLLHIDKVLVPHINHINKFTNFHNTLNRIKLLLIDIKVLFIATCVPHHFTL